MQYLIVRLIDSFGHIKLVILRYNNLYILLFMIYNSTFLSFTDLIYM